MAFLDYIWLIRLIIEILKAIAALAPEDRLAIATLRQDSERIDPGPPGRPKTKPT